jgi:hypothetical protein
VPAKGRQRRRKNGLKSAGRIYPALTSATQLSQELQSSIRRLKGIATVRLYDEANHVTVDSKPAKIDIRPENFILSNWRIPIPGRPGVFRADVMIDGVAVWRGFVRITD